MINVKDFEKIKAELKKANEAGEYDKANQKYCGPDTGIWYDEDADVIHIASDWIVDDNGDVVRADTKGPGVH